MKRVITASTSRMDALRRIANVIKDDDSFKDCKVEVNKDHNCVDVIFPDGTMTQTYPKEGKLYKSTRYDYKYVGQNNGDYIRIPKTSNRRSWEPEAEITKHVDLITKHSK